MTEQTLKYLYDISEAISNINAFIGERKVFELYQNDKKTKSAVERQITIIGEAANKINRAEPSVVLTNSRQIVGLRNRIVHAYDSIDDTIIWTIVVNHLPLLREEIQILLQNSE